MGKAYFEYNKGVNKKTKFLGVSLQELLFLLVGVILLMLVAAVLNTFGIEHWSIYAAVFTLAVGGLFGLKYANKQDHPSFIFSFLGFMMLQPQRIMHLMPGSYKEQMDITKKELDTLRSKIKKDKEE